MNQETLLALAAILLIPLVPAFLLYRSLPNTAAVGGPFKGFQINLTGSFAGYFALVLLAFSIVEVLRPNEGDFPKYEEYQAIAEASLTGSPSVDELDPRRMKISLQPTVERVNGPIGPNRFVVTMTLPAKRSSDDKVRWAFDAIVVEYPGYYTETIPIGSGKVQQGDNRVVFDPVELDLKPLSPVPVDRVELSNDP